MPIMEDTTFDPRRRRLCPDGACVGLIGEDGRCKVCGTPAGGGTPYREPDAAAPDATAGFDDDSDASANPDDAMAAADAGEDGGLTAGGFDPHRRLCDDGACVGVIAADGACNVCGRRAGGA